MSFQGECNLDQLAELIFKHGKKERGSIELGIDPAQVNEMGGDFDQYMYSILVTLVNFGIKIVFNQDSPFNLTKQQVESLSEYFWAINYTIHVTANKTEQEPWDLLTQGTPLTSIEIHFEKLHYHALTT